MDGIDLGRVRQHRGECVGHALLGAGDAYHPHVIALRSANDLELGHRRLPLNVCATTQITRYARQKAVDYGCVRSSALASSHRLSISARDDCAGVRPSAASSCLDAAEAADELVVGRAQGAFRDRASGAARHWRRRTAGRRTPRSSCASSASASVASRRRLLQLRELLLELVEHGRERGPVEADAGGFVLQLDGPRERRQRDGDVVQNAGFAFAARSAALMRSQKPASCTGGALGLRRRTRAGGAGSSCRVIASTTSAKAKAPSSSAMRA